MSGEKDKREIAELYERYFPGRNEDHRPLELPVREVTLLEDRAQVSRRGKVRLEAGRNQLRIDGVAPVLQDVSLRGEVAGGGASVSDLRMRRAMRVRREDKPERIRELEAELEAQLRRFAEASEDRERAEHRYGVVLEMLAKGAAEIPEDAAWGLVNRQVWADTFETLTKRAQDLLGAIAGRYFEQLDVAEEVKGLAEQRRAFDRRDIDFCAFIELDVVSEAACEVELIVEYVVPNALWRPLHSARVQGDSLRFCSRAAVWQNSGEDWTDVALSFSTARSSLGTEAPLLDDDMLAAQRRSEKVVVERRQVAVQNTGLGREPGAAPLAASAVELPGVDDGGEVQNLRAMGQATVTSNGLLNVVPMFEFEVSARRELLCMPELAQKTFEKTVQTNSSSHPILAGPVELVRDSGVVGWTQVLYVAPGERFELSFGHDDALRVYRTQKHESEVDGVDGWTHNDAWVTLYLSNLAGEAKALEVVERVPVSEIEHVRVAIDEQACRPQAPEVDDNGFCRWKVELPAHGREMLCLAFRLSTAPEVEGM
jgi:uncharacterized protein (TIGR02231 family)